MIRNLLHKKPLPLSRPPDLSRLLAACGTGEQGGRVGGYLKCPLCHGQSRELRESGRPGLAPGMESLHVTATLGNDYALRCHNCGFAGNGLSLYWKSRLSGTTWEEAIRRLGEFELFGEEAASPDWVERGEAWSDFESLFEMAQARMRAFENPSWNGQFGEIGVLPKDEFVERFKWAGKLSGFKKSKVYLRLVRTLHGLPAYVAIDERIPGMEFSRYYFNDPGPLELAVPTWALFRDWATELVITTDRDTAVAYQNTLAETAPIGHCVAAILVVACTGPLHEEIPARRIHYLAGPGETGEFALAFCAGSAEVNVWKAPDKSRDMRLPKLEDIKKEEYSAIEALADMIVSRTESGSHAVAYLDSLLKKPWVNPATTAVITAALRRRLDAPLDDLVRQMGSIQTIFSFRGERATYLCRNGLYLKTNDKLRSSFSPCSNFSLQIEESATDGRDVLGHSMQLRMGRERTRFRIDDSDFQDGKKLMEKATRAALAANCPTLPNLASPSDLRLLPSIVRGTQSAPPSSLSVPAHWGFSPGRFQGPDYCISALGVHCYRSPMAPPGCINLLDREMAGIAPGEELEFLSFRANEFASWFSRLPPEQKGIVPVLLHAALFWLFRGAGGGESYLALPTPEHHSLFASLLGIRPIEVGRARIEYPGVPRIMAASYSSSEQFGRQGRIVAALEATDRRLDNSVTSLLRRHRSASYDSVVAPFSLLPLLAYAVVGQGAIDGAKETFLQLVDDNYVRRELHVGLSKSSNLLVPPFKNLDFFLMRAAELIDARANIVAREVEGGMVLFKTEAVTQLRGLGYHFDERRIADELATNYELAAPIRNYGRKRIRVFQIPAKQFEIFETSVLNKREVRVPFGP